MLRNPKSTNATTSAQDAIATAFGALDAIANSVLATSKIVGTETQLQALTSILLGSSLISLAKSLDSIAADTAVIGEELTTHFDAQHRWIRTTEGQNFRISAFDSIFVTVQMIDGEDPEGDCYQVIGILKAGYGYRPIVIADCLSEDTADRLEGRLIAIAGIQLIDVDRDLLADLERPAAPSSLDKIAAIMQEPTDTDQTLEVY